jgi:hypothetical protein
MTEKHHATHRHSGASRSDEQWCAIAHQGISRLACAGSFPLSRDWFALRAPRNDEALHAPSSRGAKRRGDPVQHGKSLIGPGLLRWCARNDGNSNGRPDGQSAHRRHARFARRASVSHVAALVLSGKSEASFLPSRGLAEGRFAIVTNRGLRDAMDAASRQTIVEVTYGEVVWSWRPDAGAKSARRFTRLADDGGKKARSPGRARRTPLKPSRREGRMTWLNLW